MGEEKSKFTKEELQFLKNFEEQTTEMEMAQVRELNMYCNISFQYAKTYSNYVKDWEKVRQEMQNKLNSNNLPDDISPKVFEETIKIANKIIEKKLKKVKNNFEEKFGESIFNYLGTDGKTKGCLGVFLFIIAGISGLFLV